MASYGKGHSSKKLNTWCNRASIIKTKAQAPRILAWQSAVPSPCKCGNMWSGEMGWEVTPSHPEDGINEAHWKVKVLHFLLVCQNKSGIYDFHQTWSRKHTLDIQRTVEIALLPSCKWTLRSRQGERSVVRDPSPELPSVVTYVQGGKAGKVIKWLFIWEHKNPQKLENKTNWKTCPSNPKDALQKHPRKLWTSSTCICTSYFHSSLSHPGIHCTASHCLHRQTGSNGLHHHVLKRWRKHLKSRPEEVVVVVVVGMPSPRTQWKGSTHTQTHTICKILLQHHMLVEFSSRILYHHNFFWICILWSHANSKPKQDSIERLIFRDIHKQPGMWSHTWRHMIDTFSAFVHAQVANIRLREPIHAEHVHSKPAAVSLEVSRQQYALTFSWWLSLVLQKPVDGCYFPWNQR